MGLNTPSGGGGAPTDAEYVTGSSNSELSNETVVSPAGDILTSGSFGSTVSLSPGFGTFTQVDADNPSIVAVTALAETDGVTTAIVKVRIDESGGTTADYNLTVTKANNIASGTFRTEGSTTFLLQAGAQFEIQSDPDPNGNNILRAVRAVVITP